MTQRQRRRPWLAEAVVIAALLLLPLLFWWRLWALDPADRAALPKGDFAAQYYPLQRFAAEQWAAGHLPAWNPYLNAGQPGLGDIQTGAFYPLNLAQNLGLALLGQPLTVPLLTWQIIAHFSLASLFTYLLVRRLACRAGARLPAARFAGAVAALSFTYAGYLTTFPVQQLTILETAVWLPLILFFLDRASQRPNPLPQLILAGLALACALLAGHPQTAMYVVYTTLAYGLFQVAGSPSTTLRTGKQQAGSVTHHASRITFYVLRSALCALLPLLLGATLAAIQLLPTLQFIAHSTRAGLDYDTVAWGFPLAEITHLLYPGYFGGSPQYVGLLPPILAAAALFVMRARREVVFWIVVGLGAFLLAFGGNTFLYSLAYLLAPGLSAVRDQERIIYLFSFALSILAGYGALTLVQPLPRLAHRGFRRLGRGLGWVFAAFLALTALWYFGFLQGVQQNVALNMFEGVLRHHSLLLLILGGSAALLAQRSSGKLRRPWLMALALGLIGLNLFTINWQYNVIDPDYGGARPSTAEGPFVETDLVAFLQRQPDVFRISSAGLLPGGASAGAVFEIEDITANTPLRLETFQQFEDRVESWRRWQLLNVHYVLSEQDLDGPGLERVYEEGSVKVYKLGDPLPRAWVVYRTEPAADDKALDRLNADDFDPRAAAVLPLEYSDLALPGNGQPGESAQVVQALPGRLLLDVTSNGRGLLVISQPYDTGWQARVDGKRVNIHRVNYLLQGILLEDGLHRVELDYRLSLLPGAVSLAALVGCSAGLILKRRRA